MQSNLITYNGLFKDLETQVRKLPNVNLSLKGYQNDRFRGYLYVFQLDNDRIKLGHSNAVGDRIRNHSHTALAYAGATIKKIIISKVFKNRYQAEANLIELVIKSNKFKELTDEWFLGSFDDMIDILNQLKDEIVLIPCWKV